MRAIERLTEKKVQILTARGYHADGAGLYLQVTQAGTRSWVLRFRFGGRTREGGLGSLLDVGLAAARKKASEWRALIGQGRHGVPENRRLRGNLVEVPSSVLVGFRERDLSAAINVPTIAPMIANRSSPGRSL